MCIRKESKGSVLKNLILESIQLPTLPISRKAESLKPGVREDYAAGTWP